MGTRATSYSRKAVTFEGSEKLTESSGKEASLISNILKRFTVEDLAQQQEDLKLSYGDATAFADYQGSLNLVLEVEEKFATLPAELREKFDNDAALYVDMINDPDKKEELEAMGITFTKESRTKKQVEKMNDKNDNKDSEAKKPDSKDNSASSD